MTGQGQVTDRYTKAIEQLGSDKLDVRIGGIYALERVARDSARDHPTVMEVLTAFIREHSHEPWPPSDPGGQEPERPTRPDVQAAVTVVGRRDAKRDIRQLTSSARTSRRGPVGADLNAADLGGSNFAVANFTSATLAGVRWPKHAAVPEGWKRDTSSGQLVRAVPLDRRTSFRVFMQAPGPICKRISPPWQSLRVADTSG